VFKKSALEGGHLDADGFRADHEDWLDELDELEQRRYLVKDSGTYRVGFVVLAVLGCDDAREELNRKQPVNTSCPGGG
jgi:hypothetical protein